MTPALYLELGVVVLGAVLCLAGVVMYYGKRPEYPSVMARAESEDLKLRPSRHSSEDRGNGTQRLGPFPPKRYSRRNDESA